MSARRRSPTLATELIDAALAAGDEMEVVGALAGQLPARLTARLLGFPGDRTGRELKSWSERLMRTDMRDRDGRDLHEFMAANMEFVGVLGEVAAGKYANPTDDLISVVGALDDRRPTVVAREHRPRGRPVHRRRCGDHSHGDRHGLRAFVDHPDQWEAMAADPSLVPGAVEEVLRWVTPLNNMFRRACADAVVGGQEIVAGDRIMLLYPSANRDEGGVRRPVPFDIRRSPNPHVAFGFGTHLCIGTHVARSTLAAVFGQLSGRVTDLRVIDGTRRRGEHLRPRRAQSFRLGYTRATGVNSAYVPARLRFCAPWGTSTASLTSSGSMARTVRITRRSSRTIERSPGPSCVTAPPQVAQALAAEGVGSQDRVAFLDKNGIEHFEVFFGAALLNAVCVDVNWRLAPPEVEYIVNDAEAKVLVVGPDFVPVLDAIAANLTTVDADPRDRRSRRVRVLRGLGRVRSRPTTPASASANDDVAFQLYSSGRPGARRV